MIRSSLQLQSELILALFLFIFLMLDKSLHTHCHTHTHLTYSRKKSETNLLSVSIETAEQLRTDGLREPPTRASSESPSVEKGVAH